MIDATIVYARCLLAVFVGAVIAVALDHGPLAIVLINTVIFGACLQVVAVAFYTIGRRK